MEEGEKSMKTQFLLETKELDYLTKHFRITTNKSVDRMYSIPSLDLLNEAKCRDYLDKVTDIFESPSKKVLASQFSKRYSFSIITHSLYAMTMFNRGLDHSIENCNIESEYHDNVWLPKVRLSKLHVDQPTETNRHKWRDQVIKNIFANHIAKIWRSISQTTNISTTVLWENTAIYVYWLYEKRIGEGASESQKSRIYEDYQYLLGEAPGSLFGQSENPLKNYNSLNCTIPSPDKPVRIRKTCCYYYQISFNKVYCSTCPRNK